MYLANVANIISLPRPPPPPPSEADLGESARGARPPYFLQSLAFL